MNISLRFVACLIAVVLVVGCQQANQPPEAVLSGPDAVLVGQVAAFDCGGSTDPDGDPIVCSFDFGDGTVVDQVQRAVHAFATPGTFVVTLTVTDDRGHSGSAALQTQVGSGLPPLVAFVAPGVAIVGEDVLVDASSSADPDGSIASMTFDFGDGVSTAGSGLAAASHAYNAPGTYVIEVVARDDRGLVGRASRSIVVESGSSFNVPPTACFTAPTATFSNAPISVDAGCSVGPGAELSYNVSFGDGSAKTGRVVTHAYAQPGTYTISLVLTATYADGTTASAVMTSDIAVQNRTVQAASISPSSGSVAGGALITVKGSGFTTTTDTTVTVGGQAVLDLTVIDASTLTFRLPAGVAGAQDLRIENSNGVTVWADAFTYLGGDNRANLTWCPAAGAGTDLGFVAGDDDATRTVTMPFDFPFFGSTIVAGSDLYITSNGTISFSDARAPFANAMIPSASNPDQLIAPFFDDLNIGSAGVVETQLTGTAPNRVFTVRWKQVVDNATQTESLDFEASLYESSGDIKFQYRNPTVNGNMSRGQSATIGLQDAASSGVLASYNTAIEGLAPGGVVYRFAYGAGGYTVDQSKTLSVSASSPASDDTIFSNDSIVVTTSRPVNARTVNANGTVVIRDLTSGASFTTLAVSVIGDKTQIQVSPSAPFLFAHRYLLQVTRDVRDVNGNPLSQDPAQVTCGTVAAPVDFGLTFTAQASLIGTSNGLPSGGGPTGVAIFSRNGSSYVIDVKDSGRIQTFALKDLNNNLDSQQFGGNSFFDVVVHPSNLTAYVSDDGNAELQVIDISDPQNLAQIGGSPFALSGNNKPQRLAISADGSRVWIADDADTVHVFDTVNLQEIDTDGNGGNGTTPVAVSGGCKPYDVALANGKAYVACKGSRKVDIIDQVTYNVTSINLPTGGARSRAVAANPAGTRVYVANRNDSTLEVIDTSSDSVVQTITIQGGNGSPQDVAVTDDGRLVLVGEDGNDTVTIVDAATGAVVDTVNGFNGLFSLAIEPGTYTTIVSNNNNDTLAKIQ
ncbi:MAG: PKD domain-containing protein [Candidatus Dadabacteria bacterium]|nr:MAG: PKD domain-containing protein [Candidatus Dadabacteria bacterium]